jgi:hypothetical protein
MKELIQAKVLAAAVKISKKEMNSRFLSIQEQLDNIKIIKGPEGPIGPKGDSGDDAKPVIVEAVGPKGEQGEKGDKGNNGNALIEAGIYEDNLVLDFSDGEKLDVGKVIGPRGGQGKQGLIGEQGIVGPIGPLGEQGLVGAEGVKGDKGDQGNIGLTGKSGPVGIRGIDGIKGDQGEKGEKGPEGEKGIAGPYGPRGEKGDRGSQGEIGPVGQEGADGRLVDLKPLQTELEDSLKTFRDSISSQVTRLALSGGGSSSGGGEVLLYKLDDVDYNTVRTPGASMDGYGLVYSHAKGKWEANSIVSAITIKEEGTTVATAIHTLNFVGATVTVSNTSTTDLRINVHPEAAFIANSVARQAFLGSANVVAWAGNTSSVTTSSGNWSLHSDIVANPVGHIVIDIGGTNYKIPYFS